MDEDRKLLKARGSETLDLDITAKIRLKSFGVIVLLLGFFGITLTLIVGVFHISGGG